MRAIARVVGTSLVIAVALSTGGASYAGDDDSVVVAKIGDRSFTGADLKKAIGTVPNFELKALGTTKLDILKKYVDEAIVHEELMAAAARSKGALEDRAAQLQVNKALANALVRKELGTLGSRNDVSADDVKAYYDAHLTEYQHPERVRIWHIVVATKEDADAALAKAKKDPTREGWPKLASELSLDQNTKRSSGDLGFVTADGKTSEPRIIVPPELAKAAFALKDGELGAEPVKTAAGWHVIWRKGSAPPTVRTVADETQTIKSILFEQRREKAYKALVERLHTQVKIETDDEALSYVPVDTKPKLGAKSSASR